MTDLSGVQTLGWQPGCLALLPDLMVGVCGVVAALDTTGVHSFFGFQRSLWSEINNTLEVDGIACTHLLDCNNHWHDEIIQAEPWVTGNEQDPVITPGP